MTPPMEISSTTILYIFLGLFVLAVIIGISVVSSKRANMSTSDNVQRIQTIETPKFEKPLLPYYKAKKSLREMGLPKNQQCLVNFAPLTVAIPGFLGPSMNGVFKERDATIAALKTGARCIVLPIDYHEDESLKPPLFARAGEPCILYRDIAGTIRSLNSGSIEKVAQAIADLAWSDIVFQKNDPLILILYLKRTPKPSTKEYLRYCSQIAKELNPLMPYLLTQTSIGSFNRQAKQDSLLYDDLTFFEKKLLIFCNADLKIFRDTKSVGVVSVPTREDLDFWTHLQMFKQSEADFGATLQMGQNTFARAIVESQEYFTTIPENRVKDITDTGKIRWTLAMNAKLENPTVEVSKSMLNKFGVQGIPLYFHQMDDVAKKTIDLWKNTAWLAKPPEIRFTKPDNFKPQDPSPKLNANQGVISSPTV